MINHRTLRSPGPCKARSAPNCRSLCNALVVPPQVLKTTAAAMAGFSGALDSDYDQLAVANGMQVCVCVMDLGGGECFG